MPRLAALIAMSLLFHGCQKNDPKIDDGDPPLQTARATQERTQIPVEAPVQSPEVIEIDADSLLAAQLPAEQLEEGWVRLFDGQSPFGWLVVGKANWKFSDGVASVSEGERSYLCTSFEIPNYEFQVDFRCDPDTNSGIFLRTGLQPQDVAVECLELNIAPPDNPFPTGSFVQRKKLAPEELGEFDPSAWHTYHVRLVDSHVQVSLDGKQIIELNDFEAAESGHISLQHNEGRVEFRNVLLRPVGLAELKLGEDWKEDWTLSEKEPGTFSADVVEGGLQLTGGLGQLQSKRQFGDFFLHARYALATPQVNTGIFFRCIPETILDGYECQVNHATTEGDPLRPADAGAGAIFRRQPARIVVGDGTEPTYITLLAIGSRMATWVNGVQVTDFDDAREPDENPRRGLRTDPGPIALQGHDATTDAIFHSLKVSEL